MCKTLKLLLSGLMIVIPVSLLQSQNRTSSPFSRYGMGELNPQGFSRNQAMGGTGIGLRSAGYLNNTNPASYSALDSMSFFFETGLQSLTQNISENGASESFSEMNFDYFALGFAVGPKMGISLGFRPATQAGYDFQSLQTANNDPHLLQIKGEGNFTDLYASVAYSISPSLSAGINASYWFGDIKHTSFQDFVSDPNAYIYGSRTEHHIGTLLFDLGLQYTTLLDENRSLTLGLVFRPQTAVSGRSSHLVARGTGYDVQGGLFTNNDTLSFSSDSWRSRSFEMPLKLGVGASYTIQNKLILAADYSTERWADVQFPDVNTQTANTNYFALGAEFIPNERTGNRYHQRIRYRAGLHYAQDYIKINNNQLRDFGMAFGLGLPLGRSNTSINLGFEYGNIGTGQSSEMKETYSKFTLGFTLHEYWFFKRKFD